MGLRFRFKLCLLVDGSSIAEHREQRGTILRLSSSGIIVRCGCGVWIWISVASCSNADAAVVSN